MNYPDYEPYDPSKMLSYQKALFEHKANQVLSTGCIYTFGLWLLFLATLAILSKVF